ncbi:MAG: ATP synthase F1 subunit delta [Patescibacteria group bacterium]
MKITPKQYAGSLYDLTVGKNDSQLKDVIKSFINVLLENNDFGKAKKIIEEFEKIWNKEEKTVEAEVTSAKELDNELIKLLKNYIINLFNAKRVNLNNKIDKNILGGVIIKYEDKVIDGSLKTKLRELKNKMQK